MSANRSICTWARARAWSRPGVRYQSTISRNGPCRRRALLDERQRRHGQAEQGGPTARRHRAPAAGPARAPGLPKPGTRTGAAPAGWEKRKPPHLVVETARQAAWPGTPRPSIHPACRRARAAPCLRAPAARPRPRGRLAKGALPTQYNNSEPIQPSAIALACLSRLAPRRGKRTAEKTRRCSRARCARSCPPLPQAAAGPKGRTRRRPPAPPASSRSFMAGATLRRVATQSA